MADMKKYETEIDGFALRPPLCVFCSAPWTDDMITVFARVEMEEGYYGETYLTGKADAVMDIKCSTCKRLVYRKEIRCIAERNY